jgi:hypothetical protein
MLLVVAILCLAIPLILQSRQLRDAKIELRKLRDETGRLNVEDRSKVHVMYIGSPDDGTWKWRVFIPKGFRYGWNLASGDIPAKGLPKQPRYAFWNAQGEGADKEVLVTASLQKTEKGDWRLAVGSRIGDSEEQMGGNSITISDQFMKRTQTGCVAGDTALGSNKTELLDPGKPIVLIRYRVCGKDADGQDTATDTPMPGYMIWMSPFP